MHLEDKVCDAHVRIPIPLVHTGRPGRPPFLISKAQIETLTELRYSYAKTARMFGVSERTLLRRREEFGLPIGQSYSDIRDLELDAVLQSVYQVMHFDRLVCILHIVIS